MSVLILIYVVSETLWLTISIVCVGVGEWGVECRFFAILQNLIVSKKRIVLRYVNRDDLPTMLIYSNIFSQKSIDLPYARYVIFERPHNTVHTFFLRNF